jgi:small subunit ribosomal protein S17
MENTEQTNGTRSAAKRKMRVGRVVSDKMQKTVVVEIRSTTRHPIYKRTLSRSRRYKAHDEDQTCRVGDTVRIVETRPLSKEKRWRVAEILQQGDVVPPVDETPTE